LGLETGRFGGLASDRDAGSSAIVFMQRVYKERRRKCFRFCL